MAVLLIVGYLMSPPITAQILVRTSHPNRIFVPAGYEWINYPLNWLSGRFAAIQWFYQWESDRIDALLGPSQYRIVWENGSMYFLASSTADP